MRRLPLFLRRVLLRAGLVCGFHVCGLDLDAPGKRFLREHDVLDLRLLGDLERGEILVVVRLDRGVVDLDVLQERLGFDRRDHDLALLLEQREVALRRRARDDVRTDDRLLHRREQHLVAHALLELQRRHALRREHQLVAIRRELAVLLERRQLRDELRELRVADAKATDPRLVLEEALVDELVHERVTHFGVVEHRRVVAPAELLAHPVLLLAHHLVELLLRDLAGADCRDRRRARVAAEVVVDAEERERQRDQREDELRESLVLAEKIVHGPWAAERAERRGDRQCPRDARAIAVRTTLLARCSHDVDEKQIRRTAVRRYFLPRTFRPKRLLAEWTGLEPATPGVTGRYSNQLNYHSRDALRATRSTLLRPLLRLLLPRLRWWVLTGSNRRHSPCKGDALPTELSTPDPAATPSIVRMKARYSSASFSAFPARNLGTFAPWMRIAAPVRGLRPARGMRLPT